MGLVSIQFWKYLRCKEPQKHIIQILLLNFSKLSGEKWQYAARGAVMTMISSFGGGSISIVYSLIRNRTQIEVMDIINGILGSLVSITAGCFLYKGKSL